MFLLEVELNPTIDFLREILALRLIPNSNVNLTVGSLFLGIGVFIVILIVAKILRDKLISRLIAKTKLDHAGQYALSTIVKYVSLCIAFLFSLEVAGIDLTALSFLAGAIGIGLGFGLQNIFTNLVSGLLLLIEGPIKIGDYVDLGNDLAGRVDKIGARSTTIITNDNISVIVPNSDFITQRVTNWSHGEDTVRFRIPIGVAYGSDPEEVKKALLEIAESDPLVLKEPKPTVFFDNFGDSSLDFELAVWNRSHVLSPRTFRSKIRYAIHQKLKEKGIEIPFPQRDLHIRSSSLPVHQKT